MLPLPFQTPGYETLELSTQLVIAEALRRGVKVDVLDAASQFIRLSKGSHIEYVASATKTAKDSYVMSELLGNKQVTKLLLEEKGFSVPKGHYFTDVESALKTYALFEGKPCAVKPKTTNYGIGITLLTDGDFTQTDFEQAVHFAFQFDDSILIEAFAEGIECRFLVIGGKCAAVLNRVPANVVGDGKHSIKQLVRLKNRDPRRGEGYKTPLEKIKLGKVEKGVLAEQKLTIDSIPKKGRQIFLRHNSNISTGGDSLDFTDVAHNDYKKIAEQAVQSIGTAICGVDVILQNPKSKATKNNHAIIELNYNPVLYFHNFPYEGENRHVEKGVLDLLGFK